MNGQLKFRIVEYQELFLQNVENNVIQNSSNEENKINKTEKSIKLYKPFMHERDSLGRLIGESSIKSTKNSSKSSLPSVYQFNKKWAHKNAAKNSVSGDWESREIIYGSDNSLVINKKEDISFVKDNILQSKIDPSFEQDAQKAVNPRGAFRNKYQSADSRPLATIKLSLSSPQHQYLEGFKHFSVKDASRRYKKPTQKQLSELFDPEQDNRRLDQEIEFDDDQKIGILTEISQQFGYDKALEQKIKRGLIADVSDQIVPKIPKVLHKLCKQYTKRETHKSPLRYEYTEDGDRVKAVERRDKQILQKFPKLSCINVKFLNKAVTKPDYEDKDIEKPLPKPKVADFSTSSPRLRNIKANEHSLDYISADKLLNDKINTNKRASKVKVNSFSKQISRQQLEDLIFLNSQSHNLISVKTKLPKFKKTNDEFSLQNFHVVPEKSSNFHENIKDMSLLDDHRSVVGKSKNIGKGMKLLKKECKLIPKEICNLDIEQEYRKNI
ncbi:unnamed protein product [Moneuplotes crassus]|uniref:Uncharacterized protein n=1 Tax=Euplotes crassus TaxID=5936 RepID=A0AAD1U333_EUPCR|nr:unnamed protein product [Moneuplotes crassus]